MDAKKVQEPFEERIKEMLFSEHAYEQSPLSEEELARLLRVSRTSVREVLKVLEKEEIIERRQKKGVYLKKFSIKEIVEVFDARSSIEGFAGRVAGRIVKEKDLKELEGIARKHSRELKQGNFEKADALDRVFHRTIIQLSGNRILLRMMDTFHVMERAFKICYAIHSTTKVEHNPYSHEEIIRCFRKEKPEEVEKVIRCHVQWSKQWLIEQAMGIKLNHF